MEREQELEQELEQERERERELELEREQEQMRRENSPFNGSYDKIAALKKELISKRRPQQMSGPQTENKQKWDKHFEIRHETPVVENRKLSAEETALRDSRRKYEDAEQARRLMAETREVWE